MLCHLPRRVSRKQLARARAVLDQEAIGLQTCDDGRRVELSDLFTFGEELGQADVAGEERALAVVQPGHDHVGADFVQTTVGDSRDHFVERKAGGDGLAHLVQGERLAQPQILSGQPALFQTALHDVHDLFDLERLQDVVVRAALHGIDRGLDGAEAGHDHGQRVGMGAGDFAQQIQPAHFGHLQVTDDHVVAGALELVRCAHAVFGRAHDIALHTEEVGDDVADEFLVIDDENPRPVFGVTRVRLGHHGRGAFRIA